MEDLWTISPEELEEQAINEYWFQYEKEKQEEEFNRFMEHEYQLYLNSLYINSPNKYERAKDPG